MSDPQSRRQRILQMLEEPFFRDPVPSCLYHYTTAAGLLGILKRGEVLGGGHELWASAIGFSNDASEGRYATKIGLKVLDSNQISKDSSEPCRKTVELVRSVFSAPGRVWEEGYVVSFCENDNVLSQWRAYGGTSSFSIGFRALSTDGLTCLGNPNMRLVKVAYDVSQQKGELNTVLDGAYELLKESPVEGDIRRVQGALLECVEEWGCTLKHEAFEEEREWRITVFPVYDLRKSAYTQTMGFPPVRAYHPVLRERRGRLLPYMVLRPTSGRFDIESITVGPSKTQSLEAKAVELLKERLDLGDVEVRCSDIPLQS